MTFPKGGGCGGFRRATAAALNNNAPPGVILPTESQNIFTFFSA
jgi:hypothetical protein